MNFDLKNINRFLAVFVLFLFIGHAAAQDVSKELVGVWKFTGFEDNKGVSLANVNTVEGPVIYFYDDGNYTMSYTPTFKESGKWNYDAVDKKILYRLPIDTTSYSGKYLISNKLAIYENGTYWDQIDDPVVSISGDRLVVKDEENKYRIYKKLPETELTEDKIWSAKTIQENKASVESTTVVEEITIIKEGNIEKTIHKNADGTETVTEKKLYEIKKVNPNDLDENGWPKEKTEEIIVPEKVLIEEEMNNGSVEGINTVPITPTQDSSSTPVPVVKPAATPVAPAAPEIVPPTPK